jgi:hypothetical protein
MDMGGSDVVDGMSGPLLGILVGVPIALAMWGVGAVVALIAF